MLLPSFPMTRLKGATCAMWITERCVNIAQRTKRNATIPTRLLNDRVLGNSMRPKVWATSDRSFATPILLKNIMLSKGNHYS